MSEVKKEDVLTDEQVVDELADWFADDDDEDLAASDDSEYDEDSSPSEYEDDDEPAAKAQESDAKQASEDGTSAKEPAQVDDPYAWVTELDPDLKSKVEALVHRDRSNTGRVAALTRRLDETQARLRTVSTPRAAPRAAREEIVEDLTDDELAEFEKEFPTVARNMKKIIDQRVAAEREEVLGQVRPIQQQIQQQQLVAQKEELRRNAEEIFNTKETGVSFDDVINSPRWREWLASQPQGYQQYALSAKSVEDASRVLEDFAIYADQEVQAAHPPPQESEPTASRADQVAAKRKAARTGTSPPSRSAELADRGNSSSYEDYFNEAVEGR